MIPTGTIVKLKNEGEEKFVINDIFYSSLTEDTVYEIQTIAKPELVSLRYDYEIVIP